MSDPTYEREFRGRRFPEPAALAGYAWLIDTYGLDVPLPPRLAGTAAAHRRTETAEWLLLTPRHAPEQTLAGHVTFALKWEGVDLSVLAALAANASPDELTTAIRTAPEGRYMRRFWFLVEWLTGNRLELPDLSKKRGLVPIINPDQQYGLSDGDVSDRHRVRNTLPGTPALCPLVRRTDELDHLIDRDLAGAAREVAGRTHPDVLARAAAFLLLSDSRASFAIEDERPGPDRARRWAQAIARAGREELSTKSLESLQGIVIGDHRFVSLGLREEGGFVGRHDRHTREPLPEHISARPGDLPSLMGGIKAFDERVRRYGMEPVVAAASLAFGFVYVHPFEDGNGRIHRWIIHHALAATQFAPENVVFPVSSAMLRHIDAYRSVLESYSKPLLDHIEWKTTPDGNIEVLNDTARFYRYFDATAHAEFLYRCVEETTDHDLPEEVAYLEAYDRFTSGVQQIVDMPERTVDQLHRFLRQNEGRLSKRARTKEFKPLSDEEVAAVEELYDEAMQAVGE